jgi:hypothetical protein
VVAAARPARPTSDKPAFAVGTAPGSEKAPVMVVPQPTVVQPGMAQPGMAQPGMAQPGMAQPGMGMAQPGMAQPGKAQPGMAQPGMAQAGMAQSGMAPGMAQSGMAQPGMAQPAGMAPPGKHETQRTEKPTHPDRPAQRADSSGPSGPSKSGPVSMQPSGPVPKAEAVATGSGPKQTRQIPASPSEINPAWDIALHEIERASITTHGAYEPARVLVWTRDKVELAYPPQFEMIAEVAEEKDKLDVLRKVLQEVFGHPRDVKITVRTLSEAELESIPARSVLESKREKSTAERSKRESEAREHPITKHVLQTFGGHIKEIKTDV